ncbi:MAG: hypothetical protein ABNH00_05200 [Dokdonia sp.]|jgi:hypothetical protein
MGLLIKQQIAKTFTLFLAVLFVLTASGLYGQSTTADTTAKTEMTLTSTDFEFLLEKEKKAGDWLKQLKTPGVKVTDSTMIFSEEAQRLLKDEAYRKAIYKDQYTFRDVQKSLGVSNYQLAFWQLIHLYPDHKEDVVRFIYAYDNVFPTDEVVLAAFYTYGFFDPQITKLDGNTPNVYRPDIFEEYLRRSREIVAYILYFRKEAAKAKG